MDRYKKANDAIHAPAELKRRAAQGGVPRSRRPMGWVGAVAAVLAAVLIGNALLGGPGGPGLLTPVANGAVAVPTYPDLPDYPNARDYIDPETGQMDLDAWNEDTKAWRAARQEQKAALSAYPAGAGLEGFYAATVPQLLSGAGGENRVYSPLNLWLSLAMLAELCDGEGREALLELLGPESVEQLRELAGALWNANHREDGLADTTLGASLWLNEEVSFVQETLDRLAEQYYASSYWGKFGSSKLEAALQDWIAQQTDGMFEEGVPVSLSSDLVTVLVSTICFRAGWTDPFSEQDTTADTFYSPSGEVEAMFMHSSTRNDVYYWGDRFGAVIKELAGGCTMRLILPDEGVSADQLLADAQLMEFLTCSKAENQWEAKVTLTVNLALPRFEVSSNLGLADALGEMGLSCLFDPDTADFSPLVENPDGIVLSQATHAATVTVDEEGAAGAAVTIMSMGATSAPPPQETMDFTLDRPFLFAIVSETGQLLFTGVVNQP